MQRSFLHIEYLSCPLANNANNGDVTVECQVENCVKVTWFKGARSLGCKQKLQENRMVNVVNHKMKKIVYALMGTFSDDTEINNQLIEYDICKK